MAEYHKITCEFCYNDPLATCDLCGVRICFSHRSGHWPSPDGGRNDYCERCLTESNAPAPIEKGS